MIYFKNVNQDCVSTLLLYVSRIILKYTMAIPGKLLVHFKLSSFIIKTEPVEVQLLTEGTNMNFDNNPCTYFYPQNASCVKQFTVHSKNVILLSLPLVFEISLNAFPHISRF